MANKPVNDAGKACGACGNIRTARVTGSVIFPEGSPVNRRKIIDQEELDLSYLHKLMQSLFPKKNDCASLNELNEVVGELQRFSVKTKLQTRLLLKKHRRKLLDIDKEPLDAIHQRIYRDELGDEEYGDSVRRQYWFCYPALVRTAMEIEFGEKYEKFANEPDGI